MGSGIIMALNTFVLIPTGILMARYGRAYQSYMLRGALWFQASHEIKMMVG